MSTDGSTWEATSSRPAAPASQVPGDGMTTVTSTLDTPTVRQLLATSDTPYGSTAELWAAAGWSPVPVTRSKQPSKGVTGWDGAEVDVAMARQLARVYPFRNVALRMRRGWLGIDVDGYHDGLATVGLAYARWGRLPDTISSTNREDGSGIWYYRIPAELVTVGNLDRVMGPGVDLIQHHHRFAVVCGTHASGRRYRTSTGEVLLPEDAAQLPEAWCEGLRKAKLAEVDSGSGGAPAVVWRTVSHRRVAALLDRVADAPEGERNSVLYWASCRMFGHVLGSSPEVPGAELLAELLRRAAERAGLGALEAERTIASGRRTVGR